MMNKSKVQQGGTIAKIILSVTVLVAFCLIISGTSHSSPNAHIGDGKSWNKNMTIGDAEATNVFIDYTDYFCSYCSEIHSANNDSRFVKNYIKTGKVRLENRVTAILSGVSDNSTQGAEAAYCSADQNKYWEYSDDIISRIKSDYFDKGIGTKEVANPKKIDTLPVSYFVTSAKTVGMDTTKFQNCVTNKKHQDEIDDNTQKAITLGVNGLPYIVINDYQASGFKGDYNSLVTVLKAAGIK